jgi:hypothetical protein
VLRQSHYGPIDNEEPQLQPEKVLMSNERISPTDEESTRSVHTQLVEAAEKELAAFIAAVNELFDAEQARQAAENWIEELARTDWPSEDPVPELRRITIAAASGLASRIKVTQLTKLTA